MSPAEASVLFGTQASPGAKVKFAAGGVFKEAGLGGVGGPTYSLDLLGTDKLDTEAVFARLARIAPNRLHENTAKQREISVGRSLLRVDSRPTPMYAARIEVMTWVKGEPGVVAADAFLAAARYAAQGGPEPTPGQLRLLNGTPLSDAARFAIEAPVERAATSFGAAFPSGECKTTTDLMTKRTELICASDVDDPAIAGVRYAWPSAANARLQRVTLLKHSKATGGARTAGDPSGCLTKALGPGEKKVVDFASGRAELSWTLGKRGDRAVLDDTALEISARDGAKPEEPADWAKDYAKIIQAIATCGRPSP
jgi:hypothetical protein